MAILSAEQLESYSQWELFDWVNKLKKLTFMRIHTTWNGSARWGFTETKVNHNAMFLSLQNEV